MIGTQEQLNQVASGVDPILEPCPKCGGQLRMEYKVEWRPMTEACAVLGATPAEVIASGVKVDSFGRVKAGVPFVTCMMCGLHADATNHHEPTNSSNRETIR